MTEDKIVKLLIDKGLGSVHLPILPVSGGLLHRMYKVDTETGSYAVKHLNPNIMQRPSAMCNFKRAEALESVLESAGIPIVPALTIGGSKIQNVEGDYFYIYQWQNGTVTDKFNITADQCRIAGSIQGRVHAVEPKHIPRHEPESSFVDWTGLIGEAESNSFELYKLLKENEELFIYAESKLNEARAALPGIECIVDEDMDPKNVMWDDGNPKVIDLECLERGNPISSTLQLSLQWAGAEICDLDFTKLKAYFDGYFEAYDNGFRDYGSVFGLAYTWIEWLEYNIKRALGHCADEAEREMGLSQVEQTAAIIRYLCKMEDRIIRNFNRWFE